MFISPIVAPLFKRSSFTSCKSSRERPSAGDFKERGTAAAHQNEKEIIRTEIPDEIEEFSACKESALIGNRVAAFPNLDAA
jgi:hypothetical protein